MRSASLFLLVAVVPAFSQYQPSSSGTAQVDGSASGMPDASESVWLRGEYLLWITTTRRGMEAFQERYSNPLVNTLLTTTGTTDPELIQAAIEGKRGYRLTAGAWLDSDNRFGVEASAMWLYRENLGTPVSPAAFGAAGLPGLTGTAGGGTFSVPISAAGLVNANIQLELGDQNIRNLELVGRAGLYRSEKSRIDGLLGARCLRFEESQALSLTANVSGIPVLAGTTIQSRIGVDTRSTYLGAVIGFDAEVYHGSWFVGIRPRATVAHLENEVTRSATVNASLPVLGDVNFNSAALGLPSYTSRTWTVLPELDVRAGKQFGDNLRIMLGASLLVLPSVARATSQFETGLPLGSLLPGGAGVPVPSLILPPQLETLYLFTMSAGVELRF